MSVNLSYDGLKSSDTELYRKHSNVLKACIEANISKLPKETSEFFNATHPDIYLLEEKLTIELPVTKFNDECRQGYKLKVNDIPKECDTIRFYLH